MDENQYELAEKLQRAQIEAGISRIQRYEGESLSECAECGEEIPEGRQPKCSCGCDTAKTHLGLANGVCLISGCELMVRRWVKGVRRG